MKQTLKFIKTKLKRNSWETKVLENIRECERKREYLHPIYEYHRLWECLEKPLDIEDQFIFLCRLGKLSTDLKLHTDAVHFLVRANQMLETVSRSSEFVLELPEALSSEDLVQMIEENMRLMEGGDKEVFVEMMERRKPRDRSFGYSNDSIEIREVGNLMDYGVFAKKKISKDDVIWEQESFLIGRKNLKLCPCGKEVCKDANPPISMEKKAATLTMNQLIKEAKPLQNPLFSATSLSFCNQSCREKHLYWYKSLQKSDLSSIFAYGEFKPQKAAFTMLLLRVVGVALSYGVPFDDVKDFSQLSSPCDSEYKGSWLSTQSKFPNPRLAFGFHSELYQALWRSISDIQFNDQTQMDWFMNLVMLIRGNSFHYKDSIGLFLGLPCFFNHSCTNNASFEILENSLIVTAAKDIKENEQIFVNYINKREESSYENRQKDLLQWNFECKCQLCRAKI